jgi:hypothetical protein
MIEAMRARSGACSMSNTLSRILHTSSCSLTTPTGLHFRGKTRSANQLSFPQLVARILGCTIVSMLIGLLNTNTNTFASYVCSCFTNDPVVSAVVRKFASVVQAEESVIAIGNPKSMNQAL